MPTTSNDSNTAEFFGASDRRLPSTIKKSPRKPPVAENPHNGSAVHRNAGNGSLPQHKNGGHRVAHQKDKLQVLNGYFLSILHVNRQLITTSRPIINIDLNIVRSSASELM